MYMLYENILLSYLQSDDSVDSPAGSRRSSEQVSTAFYCK